MKKVGLLAKCLVLGLCMGALPAMVSAQEWPKKMFNELEHDFGTVARGSDTVHKFEVTNKFVEDIHIASVRSSCGCTTVSIENSLIKTYEKAYIVAKFNTRTFTGNHGATLTVNIDKPYPAQVQLRVEGFIRQDVVFEPGSINFGTVDQGTPKEQRVRVRYAGRSGWEIRDVVTANSSSDYYAVDLTEVHRQGGSTHYDLKVQLKGTAPSGYLKDQLTLVTNDSSNPRIPLDIEGQVLPEISVTPESWVMGDVAAGGDVTKKLIVRGKLPFVITNIECDDDCFTCQYGNESRTTHVVTVSFNAGDQSGRLKKQISIHTDRGETFSAICTAFANILAVPASDAATPDAEAPAGENTSTAANQESTNLAENR